MLGYKEIQHVAKGKHVYSHSVQLIHKPNACRNIIGLVQVKQLSEQVTVYV